MADLDTFKKKGKQLEMPPLVVLGKFLSNESQFLHSIGVQAAIGTLYAIADFYNDGSLSEGALPMQTTDLYDAAQDVITSLRDVTTPDPEFPDKVIKFVKKAGFSHADMVAGVSEMYSEVGRIDKDRFNKASVEIYKNKVPIFSDITQ